MIPVKRNILTLESFVIDVNGQEVILTLAKKSQLGQDMRYGTKTSWFKPIRDGQRSWLWPTNQCPSWILRMNHSMEEKTLNILFEGFSDKLATNLLSLIKSHHPPLNIHSKSIIRRVNKIIMICGWISHKLFLEQISNFRLYRLTLF